MNPSLSERLYEVRKQLALLALLTLFLLALFLFLPQEEPPQTTQQSLGESIRLGTAPIPPYTEETKEKLAEHPTFSALLSYSDQGFEPREITIKRGETIRFTNNSSSDIWIAPDKTSTTYPRKGEVCSAGDLDTCGPLTPQDFYAFTFTLPGEWRVVNSLETTKGAVVRVE